MKMFTQDKLVVAVFVVSVFLFACRENKMPGYEEEKHTEERVFVVNLVKDSLKLQEYLNWHKKVWPEVEAGFKKAGYKTISLYRFQHLLVMRITVPAKANLDSMGKVAESYNEKCAAWNKLMGNYQTGVEGTKPGQTWVEAEKIYSFRNE